MSLRIYLNEPDFFEEIDFSVYPEIKEIYRYGDDGIPYEKINAVFVGLKDVVDDSFLERFISLSHVVSNTTGVDHIQTTRNITVINLDPSEIESVSATAEFTLALMLSLVRKIPFIDSGNVADRKAYRGIQLSGLQLGIIGLGRLGKKMSKYAEALEMKWSYVEKDSSSEEFEDLLRSSDIISIHVPLREETIDFIDKKHFSMMDRKPYVINSSRPQVINKEALISALENNQIKGMAMDFINYDASSNWDNELKRYVGEKLLLTPHIGGNTHQSVSYTARTVLEKWLRVVG